MYYILHYNESGLLVAATSKQFPSKQEANRYLESVSPSLNAFIVYRVNGY